MSATTARLMILLGGTCMSFVGLVLRLIEDADGFQILFYRSIGLSAVLVAIICLRRAVTPLRLIGQIDRHDLAMGLMLSLAFATYVFSMLYTSVGATLFLLTVAPFLTALLAWFVLGERVRLAGWLTMIAALVGVGLMMGTGVSEGRLIGNFLAIVSAGLFAVMLVIARHSGKSDVMGGTLMGGCFAILLAGLAAYIVGSGLAVSTRDLGLSLFMGVCTIGIGIALVTWATPYVPAAEVAILVLIESVAGPVWVWLFLGETMQPLEVLGGVIVMSAVVLFTLFASRSSIRRSDAQSQG